MSKRHLVWLIAAGLTCWASPAMAQSATADAAPGPEERLAAGTFTFQAVAGYFTRTGIGPGGPALDYAPVGVRLGYVISDPQGGVLRGCAEALLEANYSPIIREFGTHFVGPNAILRYNFVHPDAWLVPYFQFGAGIAFTDAYKAPYPYQILIDNDLEFLLRAEAGARFMLTEDFSLDLEGGFQHVSNSGLGKHNGGINNAGCSVGFTYFFGKVR
jgi:hypothetical protein